MKNTLIAALILCACLTASGQAQEQKSKLHLNHIPQHYARSMRSSDIGSGYSISRLGRPQLPASASQDIIAATCPPDATGAVCGYVPVPLNRSQPQGTKLNIYFELYPHSNPGPAQSAILVNFGGPGGGTAIGRGFAQYLFGANLDAHDLLLIDDRGRGMSQAIDCPDLQHGTEGFAKAEGTCAASLGDAASLYGSGDVAEDTETVRAALGYELVDYFGASYGGEDVTAYATRYGNHLRSIVMDAPNGEPALNEFARLHYRTQSDPRMVRLACSYSPTCSLDHPNPAWEFTDLVERIRQQPVEGNAYNADGQLVHVRLGESALLNFIVTYPSGYFTNTGELVAAARALKNGDPAPLLRLGAEGKFTLRGDSGDPAVFSAGDWYATGCVDAGEPWQWSDPVAIREQDYSKAVAELPQNYFSPFSKGPPTGLLFSTLGKECLWWEVPIKPAPVVPSHAKYPHVPTLILEGDMDNRVPLEETTKVAALFPGSLLVNVAAAGHYTVNWTYCAQGLASEFIENLSLTDTSCASVPETVWPAVGRFPLFAREARVAKEDSSGTNRAGPSERKVVTVAVATATDAWQRSLIGFGDGVGLRSGSFHTDYGDTGWTTTLDHCAFAKDVLVSGTLIWGYDTSFVADLTVSGSGTAGGTLHVEGFWLGFGAVGNFRVTGMLGGKEVAVLVPEA